MLSFCVVDEIKRLLKEGNLSQRKIARQVGVSRGTVHGIAQGRRADYKAQREAKREFVTPVGPPVRCPTCGGMVQMPCLACRVRAMKERRRPERHRAGVTDDEWPSEGPCAGRLVQTADRGHRAVIG